ncbi:MAG: glycosyltransferase family 2 protein, partial [Waterburya sp.]
MPSQHVTLVIATYKRVEALRCTLTSLILQQYQDWTALVIGDCCSDETAEMIRSLGESRIKYYNFPERFGEQS